jgi:Ca-activated chloride channel family protein
LEICLLVVVALGVVHGAAVTLRGTVTDTSGGAIPGATVEVRLDTTVVARLVTDKDGAFEIAGLAPGNYTVSTTLEGFRPSRQTVHVTDSGAQLLRIVLDVGTMSETVTVTGSSSLVNTQSSSISGGRGRREPPVMVTLQPYGSFSTATYDKIDDNGFKRVADAPLSTFSIDVDTASYANVRRFLNSGSLPPADAVRVEELINYFHFDYPAAPAGRPFSVTAEVGPCPWNERHSLALIGLQSNRLSNDRTPPRNLVFLLDVSGSMQPANRLPLVQSAMLMLTGTLRAEDRVAIVVYAGNSGLALPSTAGNRKHEIERAVHDLRAGGSTNGAQGIQLAYQIAAEHFIGGGINRVILATDGDFNVGTTSPGDLVRLIEEKRKTGVFLSVLGVGDDNLKDATMEKLADAGNGNYSYLDSLTEARRVLVAEAGSTLAAVAKDVKVQVEFNPARVAGYRLIGYEDRLLANEDFKNDRKDAGDIGAGHSVTALYEIVPAGGEGRDLPAVDPLKYQTAPALVSAAQEELMTVKLRYKAPDGDTSVPMDVAVRADGAAATSNLRFAAAVAEFGMLLRQSPHRGKATWSQAASLAKANRGEDADGYRAEFIRLADVARSLDRRRPTETDSRR